MSIADAPSAAGPVSHPPMLPAALAGAFLDGDWQHDALVARGAWALGGIRPPWLSPLAGYVLAAYREAPCDRHRELAAFVAGSSILAEAGSVAYEHDERLPEPRHLAVPPTAMGIRRWPVAVLDDVAGVAALLAMTVPELEWFADARGMQRRTRAPALHHYRYRWLPTRTSARLLEAPRPRLRAAQRTLLEQVVGRIPAHAAVHGFVPGRSAVTGARVHVGADAVVCLDLEAFFASVCAGRVWGILRSAGYPEDVAHVLAGLCTTATPFAVLRAEARGSDREAGWRLRRRLATPHLPQGAPTSPALANLCAYPLDRRLAALAERAGLRYTRYADDLTFSGDRLPPRAADRLLAAVARIVTESGFRLNAHKTRVRGRDQRQEVTGIVVNERASIPRADYDALRALLHNAAVHGPASQNRSAHPDFRAHLLGHIAWVGSVDPVRGARLRTLYDRIGW